MSLVIFFFQAHYVHRQTRPMPREGLVVETEAHYRIQIYEKSTHYWQATHFLQKHLVFLYWAYWVLCEFLRVHSICHFLDIHIEVAQDTIYTSRSQAHCLFFIEPMSLIIFCASFSAYCVHKQTRPMPRDGLVVETESHYRIQIYEKSTHYW